MNKVSKQNLVDQVLVQLQNMIQSETYSLGDKLPSETELMKLLDVGRSTIREAIKTLVYMGLVEVRQGDGTYIRSYQLTGDPFEAKLLKADGQEMNEVIQILDIQISGLAAQRRTEEDLEKISRHLEKRNQYLTEGNIPKYLQSDLDFHYAICEASHNSVLIDMYTSIHQLFNQMLDVLIQDEKDYYKENNDVHKNLYQAIIKQNPEEAKMWAEVNIKLRNTP
ncbi:FadR/GntR family transcriptional regulator [Metabacillus sp. B2-18]|uniref:FadR/GntR family transcriptional regulator n=1 Tax=Metabacillus sp. B2-18 TaxID=2897333 RepID=UPI001E3B1715|nr:FadR/GntR family transcriptional regulator [Metabacillus sp. B2-18]UGB33167.1 FadR family transcriptional regulator [Metabacillus sp. B2-18]